MGKLLINVSGDGDANASDISLHAANVSQGLSPLLHHPAPLRGFLAESKISSIISFAYSTLSAKELRFFSPATLMA